jgi:hypothetical protein
MSLENDTVRKALLKGAARTLLFIAIAIGAHAQAAALLQASTPSAVPEPGNAGVALGGLVGLVAIFNKSLFPRGKKSADQGA